MNKSEFLKKEIYIPIEIKAREFVSQVYLSGDLASKGARVFLGSKHSIDRLVKEKRTASGAYLYKGGGSTVEKFKRLGPIVSAIAVLDQEISPALVDYDFIRTRFVEGSLNYVSRLYYIGAKSQHAAGRLLKEIDPKNIKAYGWPRVDLWMPSKHHIWAEEVGNIQQEFGKDFFLFSSDFGANSERLRDERTLRYETTGARKTGHELDAMRRRLQVNLQSFNRFMKFLGELDKDPRCPQIVVRPHPAEEHDVWFERTAGFKNVSVVYRGDITPWLLASKGLLHRGCTTAVQAAISHVNAGFLVDFAVKDSGSLVPELSQQVKDIEELIQWTNADANSPGPKDPKELMLEHITFPEGGATSKIAADLIEIAGDAVVPSTLQPDRTIREIVTKFSNLFRSRIQIRSRKQENQDLAKLPKYNKMQDGVNHPEVKKLVSSMYPKNQYQVQQISKDLCQIENIG